MKIPFPRVHSKKRSEEATMTTDEKSKLNFPYSSQNIG
jgi:hypothetical protein